MAECIIPPWVRPESPETIRLIDDATVAFQPAFGRGMTQRGIFADPRWGLRRRYRGLRSDEKAAILTVLNESRGQFNTIRVTPHTPIRGSFATSELLTNNTFASGTTGWTASNASIAVSDRVLRTSRSGSTTNPQFSKSGVTVVQYAPYVVRGFFSTSRGLASLTAFLTDSTVSVTSSGSGGLTQTSLVPLAASVNVAFYEASATGGMAGDFFEVPYVSLARCALIDNSPNLLLQSDNIDNAAWLKARCSTVANTTTAPDGTTTAEGVIEDSSATSTHGFTPNTNITVSSSAADYCYCAMLKANTRTWAYINLVETTGSTAASGWFNLGTGAVGSTTVGANWSNARTFIVSLGNGWYACYLVARKTNAATTLSPQVFLTTGDAVLTYSGNGSSSIYAWRQAFAQSSVPMRSTQTTSAAVSAAAQSGSSINTKGWPASTSGLLLTGDWFEINGELKQLTAPVNSDAAGMATMQFRPSLAGSPADNDPIVVYEPFGRFIYPGTREFENLFGIYGDCEMNLEEVYS